MILDISLNIWSFIYSAVEQSGLDPLYSSVGTDQQPWHPSETVRIFRPSYLTLTYGIWMCIWNRSQEIPRNVTVQEIPDLKFLSVSSQFKHDHFEHRDGDLDPTGPTTVLHSTSLNGMSRHIERKLFSPSQTSKTSHLDQQDLEISENAFWSHAICFRLEACARCILIFISSSLNKWSYFHIKKFVAPNLSLHLLILSSTDTKPTCPFPCSCCLSPFSATCSGLTLLPGHRHHLPIKC